MEENVIYSALSVTNSIFSTLKVIVASQNACIEALTILEEEEEDEHLTSYILDVLNCWNLILMLELHQGNQCQPPKQSVFLFPEFVSSEFEGRDLLSELVPRPWLLYSMTGETVQSFDTIIQDLAP